MLFGTTKTIVGLDVGSYAVKAVAVQAIKGRVTLQGYALARIADRDPSDVVRQVIDQLGLRPRRTVTSVSGRSVIVRQIETPRIFGAELHKHISSEADKFIPFGAEEVVIDCQPVEGAAAKTSQQQVMVVAVRRSLIQDHLALLKASGIHPEVIDVDVFALANCYEQLGPMAGDEDKRATALVDIGAAKTNIAIVRNGQVLFTREIYLAGNEISDAIARAMNEPTETVDAIKTAPGDALDQILDAAMPAFEDLANEVRLSFDYVEGQFDAEVATVVLSGGSALLPNAAQVLGNILGRAVHVFDPMAGLDLVPSRYDITALDANSPTLTIALGLALHQLDLDIKGLGGSQSHAWQARTMGSDGVAVVPPPRTPANDAAAQTIGTNSFGQPTAATGSFVNSRATDTIGTSHGSAQGLGQPVVPTLAPPPPVMPLAPPPPMIAPPPAPMASKVESRIDIVNQDQNRSGLLVVLEDDQDAMPTTDKHTRDPASATFVGGTKSSRIVRVDDFDDGSQSGQDLPPLPELPKLPDLPK